MWIIGFFVCWAFLEFLVMLIFVYDDYGENWPASLITSIIIFGVFAIVNNVSIVKVSQQDTQLEDQWSESDIENLLTIEAIEDKEVTEYYNDVEQLQQPQEDTNEVIVQRKQIVPSNISYIETGRRNYEITVVYDHETREACDDIECFKVQLIQHTDGTFWACKRNYGVCYEY